MTTTTVQHHPEVPTCGGPKVLALESSCDETAAAVLDGTRSLLSNVVNTQIALHAQYGGVVPELASRAHIMAIPSVVEEALRQAECTLDDIEAVVVTRGPGLTGSLLVGIEFAKGICASRNLPMVGVHHLEGHLHAPFLSVAEGYDEPGWPAIVLVVSGGHTSLYHAKGPGEYDLLGRTLDDAAGEAYDKVSKRLGLGYPGGAVIDGLAEHGNPEALDVPRPMLTKGGLNFSFSGVKTWVANYVDRHGPLDEGQVQDLAASFQEAVCDVLVTKALRAAKRLGVDRVVISGGVACNSRLRSMMRERAGEIDVVVPPPVLCTDNAAMIGAAGYAAAVGRIRAREGFREQTLDAVSSWPLGKPVELPSRRRRKKPTGPPQS